VRRYAWLALVVALIATAKIMFSGTGLPQPGARDQTPPAKPNADARLVLPAKQLDLGVIPHDAPTPKTFEVKNAGSDPLQIDDVKTNCGCTVADIQPRTIPPGGTGTLTITVDPARLVGFDVDKTVNIVSNGAKRRDTVTVVGKIDPEFIVDPPLLDLGNIHRGAKKEAQIVMRQAGGELVELKNVKLIGERPGLTLAWNKTPDDVSSSARPQYVIKLTLTPPANQPAGPYIVMLDLETTCKRLHRLRYNITAQIQLQ